MMRWAARRLGRSVVSVAPRVRTQVFASGLVCCGVGIAAVGVAATQPAQCEGMMPDKALTAGSLAGKKAIVFGGTSGIGLATAARLHLSGAEVIAVSRDPLKAGADASSFTLEACDVRDREALKALFAKHAPFDILVSAATGGDRAIGPFLEMDMDGYQASFDKLWGYTNVVRFGAGGLTEKGCIVLVSGAPARRARPGQIALASVGGAVEQFTRAVASELAPRRINVVSPGVIETPMFGAAGAERDIKLKKATSSQLIPRAGTPDECAQAVMFLVQNQFVTGTTVDVDGGWLSSL